MNTICMISGQIILDPMTITIQKGELERVLVCEARALLNRLNNTTMWHDDETQETWDVIALHSDNEQYQETIASLLYTPLPSRPATPCQEESEDDIITMELSKGAKIETFYFNATSLLEELNKSEKRSWVRPGTNEEWDIHSLVSNNAAHAENIKYILARPLPSPPTPRRRQPLVGVEPRAPFAFFWDSPKNSPKVESSKSPASSTTNSIK